MDTLMRLQAEAACRDLVLAAAQAVDQQDYRGLAALFAEDATLVRPGGQALQGRSEILGAYSSKSPDRLTRHLVCNHRVTVEGPGSARSRCTVLLYASDRRREAPAPGRLADPGHQVGEFDDHLVLTQEGWRIQERRAWFEFQSPG